jgi:hypothetical protein
VLSPPPLRAPSLTGLPRVVHAFSHSLRTPEDHRAFAAAAGLGDLPIQRLPQVHGRGVVRFDAPLEAPVQGDALVTDRPGFALAVAHADCVPILLADPAAGVIAAVHAGWRGMRARVIPAAIAEMARLGASPERLHAAIGPAVQRTCYEVGDEVRAEFAAAYGEVSATFFTGRNLDLAAVARHELGALGVAAERIATIDLCTHCRPELASYRREGKARGTNLAVIARVR